MALPNWAGQELLALMGLSICQLMAEQDDPNIAHMLTLIQLKRQPLLKGLVPLASLNGQVVEPVQTEARGP